MDLFQKLNDEGVTIVMITHDSDIAEFAQRKIMIRDGIIVPDLNHTGLHAHRQPDLDAFAPDTGHESAQSDAQASSQKEAAE